MTPEQHIYQTYPRHVGAVAAYKAISKAVARLMKGEAGLARHTQRQAQIRLFRAAKEYATSLEGSNPDKTRIPHPSTWFNQGRYLDDPSEWQFKHTDFRVAEPQKPFDAWMTQGPTTEMPAAEIEAFHKRQAVLAAEHKRKLGIN